MISSRTSRIAIILLLCCVATALLAAENPAANTHPRYMQLRNLSLGTEAVSVSNLRLKRDAATFELRSGVVCFVAPVEGKVTGAVFVGDGLMTLEPPTAVERASLKLLSKEAEFREHFSELVLRFTDGTYDELKRGGTAATGTCDPGLLRDTQNAMRKNRMLKYNLEGRILEDVLSPVQGGLFVAFIKGKKYNSKEIFVIDPNGAPPLIHSVPPEEVELVTYDENKLGTWAAFHLIEEYKSGQARSDQKNGVIAIEHQQIDATMEKSGNLIGKVKTTFVAQMNGRIVIPFDLFRTLRVQSVTTENGEPLSFIQEDKDDDANFFVILPSPLGQGEKFTIVTSYAGKEAVVNEGNGNYFPVARDDWYPNVANSRLGNYASYDMTFRVPKGMTTIATGTLVSEGNEGNQTVTVWKSEVPQTVAGFNFGKFKREEVKLNKPEYIVQSFANTEPPDWVRGLTAQAEGSMGVMGEGLQTTALGNMSTTPMLKKALAEGQISMGLYTDYFGPLPYKRLALTQQTACNFGQAWPALVWLPICSFFDSTVRHELGLDWGDRGYWKTVTPHEVAHQWWGHHVGFNSYRDQWMSEGFADLSASLFIQATDKDPKRFIQFWNDERDLLLEKNKEGFRPIDAGPLTMGYRLSNSRVGYDLTRRLIYPKGAYVLHMLRMMLWNRQTGDQAFKAMMQDVAKTYANRAATTEGFKEVLERHMTAEMNLDGNGRMDWFFNQYVYGTVIPSYQFTHSFEMDANGDVVFVFKVAQSNVSGDFRMLVPVYLEMADGRVIFLGRAGLTGNNSIEQRVPIQGLKMKPRRAMINYYADVLELPN